MAADQARLLLTQQLGRPAQPTTGQADAAAAPQTMDDSTATWPAELLNALPFGRRLVAEVPAARGRRSFVDITPMTDDRDRLAEREGWQRPDRNRGFRVQHWDYDEQMIDGWDYDVGARLMRSAIPGRETALLELIAAWGLRPTDFTYPWKTADPK